MSAIINLEEEKLQIVVAANKVEKELLEIDAELETYTSRIIWHCLNCESDNVWREGEAINACEVCETPADQKNIEIAKTNNLHQKNAINVKKNKALAEIEVLKKEVVKIDKKIARIRRSEENKHRIKVVFGNIMKGFKYTAFGCLIASILAMAYTFGYMMIGSNGVAFETYMSNVSLNIISTLQKASSFISLHFVAMFRTMINTAKYVTLGAGILKLLNVSEPTNQFRILFSMIIGNFVNFFNVIIGNVSNYYQKFFG